MRQAVDPRPLARGAASRGTTGDSPRGHQAFPRPNRFGIEYPVMRMSRRKEKNDG